MAYIIFDNKTKRYQATGERPGNQSETETLYKIRVCFKKTLERNPGLELTDLQYKFTEEIKTYKDNMVLYFDKLISYKNKFLEKINILGLQRLSVARFEKLNNFFEKIKNKYNSSSLASKISKYIKKNIKKTNDELEVDNISTVFVHLKAYNSKVKKYQKKLKEKFSLSELDIDIAHGIAISKIISFFVYILNKGEKLKKTLSIKPRILATNFFQQRMN